MMRGIISFIIVLATLTYVLFACSGRQGPPGEPGGLTTGVSGVSSSTVDSLKTDIQEYVPPADIDNDLFDKLAEKLLSDFTAFSEGRLPSQGGGETVELDVVITDNEDETSTYAWRFHHSGDYDLSGDVGVPDITPIAQNYLSSTTDGVNDRFESFIDGDSSGEIGIADITPIAENYLSIYQVCAGFFSVEPQPDASLEEWQSGASSFVQAMLPPPDEGFVPLTINLDAEDDYYGQVSLTFSDSLLPESPGEYFFVVRSLADPPAFIATAAFSVESTGPPVIESVTPTAGAIEQETTFEVHLASGEAPFTYAWDFNGAATPETSEEASPTVLLGEEGAYVVSVTVTNELGSDYFENIFEILAAPEILGVEPAIVYTGQETTFVADVEGVKPTEYSWDFGGGATPGTSDEESPTVTVGAIGTYSASLSVSNEYGSDSFEWSLDIISPAPVINSVEPTNGFAGEWITMTADLLGAPPFQYAWMFDNAAEPSISSLASPTIFLTTPGVYDMRLTVSNEFGDSEYNWSFWVYEGVPQILEVSPLVAPNGREITFSATVIGRETLHYMWDFGDGATPKLAFEENPTVTTNPSSGKYSGSLTVVNDLGEDVFPFTLNVIASPFPPVIESVTPTEGDSGEEITMSAVVTGTLPIFYSWDFGDGADPNTSTSLSPTVTLLGPGTYDASLNVSNDAGSDTYPFTLTVHPIAGQWTTEIVEFGGDLPTGWYASLVFLPTGEPMIAYQEKMSSSTAALMTTVKRDSVWETEVVDDGSGGITANVLDMALDGDGNPVIAYQYVGGEEPGFFFDLMVAWWNGVSWDISSVDSDPSGTHQTGLYIDIDFAPSGKGLIAHLYGHGGQDYHTELRSVIWDGSSWNAETVIGDPHEPLDIAGILDANETPVCAGRVFDFDTGDKMGLRVFWYDGSDWVDHQITTDIDDGYHISMALDGEGNPSLCWYDYNLGDLKYIRWTGTEWGAVETVRGMGDAGTYSCLAYSPDGVPYISYYYISHRRLQLAYKPGSIWINKVIDDGGAEGHPVGKFSSIAFDLDGLPHIAYQQFGAGQFALKYATLH